MPLNPFLYNENINNWSKNFAIALKSEIQSLNISHLPQSPSDRAMVNIINAKTKQTQGLVNRISIRMPRHAIFVHKGAGKGRGGSKGSKWINAKGEQKTTESTSLGKMNTGNRKAKPWFNPVLENHLPELQNIVANQYANMVINALKIKHEN